MTDSQWNDRHRLLALARYRPEDVVAAAAEGGHGSFPAEMILENLPQVASVLLRSHRPEVASRVCEQLVDWVALTFDAWTAHSLLKRIEIFLGHRKPSLAIYDHALHLIGGGQRYSATIAAAVQDDLEVTFLANTPVKITDLEEWYRLDLSRCRVRVIRLDHSHRARFAAFDLKKLMENGRNSYDAVARVSAEYDIFVNANMLERVRPLSTISIFICHFPDVLPRDHFAVREYDLVVVNSGYGAEWVRKKWNIEPQLLLYPPVGGATRESGRGKEKIILSVARFEAGGSKKQMELIHAFRRLRRLYPDLLEGWKLVLVGGSIPRNPYLDSAKKLIARGSDPVQIRVNVSATEIQSLYESAEIFWHACGLGESEPHLIEHFGMTTVEAMNSGCAPVVFCGGGLREIVVDGQSGLLFRDLDELCAFTMELVEDPVLRARLQEGARERSKRFSRQRFDGTVKALFGCLAKFIAGDSFSLSGSERDKPADRD